ncbi:MAG: ATP-binding protein [Gemmatimonadota bacterium]
MSHTLNAKADVEANAGARLNASLDDQLAAQFEACSTEPIHTPGAIQPHGFLFTIAEPSFEILQYSANALDLLEPRTGHSSPAGSSPQPGDDPRAMLRDALDQIIAAARVECERAQDLARPTLMGIFELGDTRFDAMLHRSRDVLVLELERAERSTGEGFAAMQSLVRALGEGTHRSAPLSSLCETAAREMHRITGFGRTLVYRFDADGHGEVLAECIDGEYESYMGHRFPASDIPSQARDLYLRNPIRIIPDANYTPAELQPTSARGVRATDLTFAGLRSVSPVHLEYMRNMGTLASMSVSIIVKDRLWGLISCHHAGPRYLPYSLRLAAEHLGQILALQIESRESLREAEHGLTLRRLLVSLVTSTAESGGAVESLADAPEDLMRFGSATGAAVISEGRLRLVGDTPPPAQVTALAEWVALQARDVVTTDRLGEVYPPARAYAHQVSGLLAISVSQLHRNFVLWFRPEVSRTVLWAGNPNKSATRDEGDGMRLHPRRSFATWREDIGGRAEPWRASEEAVAAEFRHAMLNIVLRRAEEVASLAGELGRINKELEAFSYSVSHDLRAPLRHITGYADLVRDYDGAKLSERGVRFLQNIKDSAKFAGTLVDDLLAFSQMGRTTLRPTRVAMSELVQSIVRDRRMDPASASIEWEIGPLPELIADPVFMQVVMQNLIDNAVKYSSTREHPRVEISSEDTDEAHLVRVSDNGVGFDMRYVNKLFGVFQRLHGMEEFSGTGIGLASVRRAIERHGGTVHAQGELDRGATFSFALPKAARATAAGTPHNEA